MANGFWPCRHWAQSAAALAPSPLLDKVGCSGARSELPSPAGANGKGGICAERRTWDRTFVMTSLHHLHHDQNCLLKPNLRARMWGWRMVFRASAGLPGGGGRSLLELQHQVARPPGLRDICHASSSVYPFLPQGPRNVLWALGFLGKKSGAKRLLRIRQVLGRDEEPLSCPILSSRWRRYTWQ